MTTPKTRLTTRFIETRPPAPLGKRVDYHDALVPGLSVRITDKGSRSFVLHGRFPHKPASFTRLTLGSFPGLELDDARDKARLWLRLGAQGRDPRQEEALQRREEAAKAAWTVRKAWERYQAYIAHHRSAGKIAQIFNAELLPVLGDTALHALTRQHVKDCVRTIAKRTVYQAYAAFSNLRTFLNWCRDEGDWNLEVVATDGMKAAKVVGRPRKHRKRVLSDDEIFAFWRATRPERWGLVNEIHRRLIRGRWQDVPFIRPARTSSVRGCRVLLLTGARLNEILEADRSEMNPEASILTVPPERFKSDEAHMVHLSVWAQKIIAELPKRNSSKLLFSDDGKRPAKIWTKDRRRLDRRMLLTLRALARLRGQDPKAATLPPFVLHDLRRTVRTRLSALKVPREIAEMVLGHGRKGLERVYDQHEFREEMREALERWAARLREIVQFSSAKIIDFAEKQTSTSELEVA